MADRRMDRPGRTLVRHGLLAAALALGGAGSPARAVIIDTVSGTGNTSAPADNPGWSNVGVRGAGSGVYLGDRWVLTAGHVGAGSIVLGGTSYAVAPNTAFTLNNAGAPGRSTTTDLVMYRLATDPGLPYVSIAATTPANGTPVTMIGAGLDRGTFRTWYVTTTTSPWTWTATAVSPNAGGYDWGSGRTMRWGTNAIAGAGWLDAGFGDVYSVATTFNDFLGDSTEAQAATGDSGGAVFHKNGATWELTGLMLAVDAYSGQPASTAVFGNNTYIADLSYYRPQIVAVVPEPAAGGLAAVGAGAAAVAFLMSRWRRGRRLRGGSPLTSPAAR